MDSLTESKRTKVVSIQKDQGTKAAASCYKPTLLDNNSSLKVPVTKSFKQLLKKFRSAAGVAQSSNDKYSSDDSKATSSSKAGLYHPLSCEGPNYDNGDFDSNETHKASLRKYNNAGFHNTEKKRHSFHLSVFGSMGNKSIDTVNNSAATARRSNSLCNTTAFFDSFSCSIIEEEQQHSLVLHDQRTTSIPVSVTASSITSSSYLSSSDSGAENINDDMQLIRECATSHKDRHFDEVHLFELQQRLWREDTTLCPAKEIARFLGSYDPASRSSLLHLYMKNFDFTDQKLDMAFRILCKKLYLKAEAQELDRIVESFAKRYYDCNPTTIFRHADIIYAIAYSLLLLNTDLHAATDYTNKMSKAKFVDNTMETIRQLMKAHDTQLQIDEQHPSVCRKRCISYYSHSSKHSLESGLSTMKADKSDASASRFDIISLEKTPTNVSCHSYATTGSSKDISSNNTNIRVIVNGFIQKVDALSSNISWRSSDDSHSVVSNNESRSQQLWLAKVEGLLKDMYAAIKSQRLDQANSTLQPPTKTTPTSVGLRRSKTLPKQLTMLSNINTQTSMSGLSEVNETSMKRKRRQSAIHLLTRSTKNRAAAEAAAANKCFNNLKAAPDFLTGFDGTIVKEGLVMRKHVMEAFNKKARQRQWQLCYLRLNSTELSLHKPKFRNKQHPDNSRRAAQQGRRKSSTGLSWSSNNSLVLCNGSLQDYQRQQYSTCCWMSDVKNAAETRIAIHHTHATTISSPGWNSQRAHVFRLETSEGEVWLFETADEAANNSWTDACNEAAARISKGLLHGAVSNINYGWGHQNPNDSISVWYPPAACVFRSNLKLEDQYDEVTAQIENLQRGLKDHLSLKIFVDAKTSLNTSQALKNWDKKHEYILKELTKFCCYKDALDKLR